MDDGKMSTQKEEEGDRLLIQGNEHYQKSQFREALASWLQALIIYWEIGNRQGEAASLGNLGNAYQSLGEFQLAIDCHKKSLEIAREIGDREGEGASLGSLGNAYDSLGKIQLAIDYHQQHLEISKKIGDREGEATSLGNLGITYKSLGKFQLAIDYHKKSLEIAREIEDRQPEANCLGSLGNVYQSLGQFLLAIKYYQDSLAINLEIGNRQGEANCLGSLGNVYQSLEQFQLAINYQRQSLEIWWEIGDRQGEANCLGNLGNAYQSLGQFQLARDYHQQYLEIAREIGDRQGEANCLGNLGNVYQSLEQFQLAINYHQQSLEISWQIGDRQGEAIVLNNLGATLKKLKQFPEAEENLRKAITILEELRTDLFDDIHRVSIFETQIAAYRNLQEVMVAQDKLTEALEISERGRTRAFIELLRQKLSEPEKAEKAEKITDYLTTSQIQQVAQNQNATLVEYSILLNDIYIWVIQPTGNITFRRANLTPLETRHKSLDDLQEIILKARVSIGVDEKDSNKNRIEIETDDKRDSQSNFPLLQLLHEILIAPIADLLPSDPESPIIFIPHYALFLVPFAALQNPQGRYFIEDHTPLIAPSIEVLKHTQTQHQQVRGIRQKALVIAEPTLHQKFQEDPYKLRPYPFMEAAAESIATILETTAITGDKATKVAVINGMLETRIVHIFAHGLLDEYKPDEIAKWRIPGTIVLAPADGDDGALNAAEIIDKQLNCEIVVLSACSTGKGTITGDGIIGLSRCFILAGVPSLIVSLWNIGAPAAKVLMTQFYQNLAKGENRGAALRHAMLETKARFPNPECWAGFTLIGETTSLTLTTQNIEEALRAMSIPENATPKAIVEAFTRLFDFYEQNFLNQIHGLDILPTDSIEQTAEKIKAWCKTHQNVEENIENDLCKMGLSDADDEQEELDEDKVKACYEKYLENLNRQGLKSNDSITHENDDTVNNS
jgi:CHAT domain-containing protein